MSRLVQDRFRHIERLTVVRDWLDAHERSLDSGQVKAALSQLAVLVYGARETTDGLVVDADALAVAEQVDPSAVEILLHHVLRRDEDHDGWVIDWPPAVGPRRHGERRRP